MAVDTELEVPASPHTRPNQPSEGARHPSNVPVVAPPTVTDSDLPAGVHPMDQGGPTELQGLTREKSGEPYKKGREPFHTKNGDAFPVYQRAASHFRAGVVAVNANEGGTAQVLGRLAGRVSVTLWVPAQLVVGGVLVTPPNGILYAPTEGELQAMFNGAILNIGDSVSLPTESAVHVGLIPGASLGYVQYMEFFNPPGGGITGNT